MAKPPAKGTSGRGQRDLKVKVKTAKGRKLSSTRWLERQLNDPYVARARRESDHPRRSPSEQPRPSSPRAWQQMLPASGTAGTDQPSHSGRSEPRVAATVAGSVAARRTSSPSTRRRSR